MPISKLNLIKYYNLLSNYSYTRQIIFILFLIFYSPLLFSQEGEKIKNLCEQGKCKEAELLFLKNKKLNKDNIINVRYLTDCFSNSGNNKYAIDFSLKVLNELQSGGALSKNDSLRAAYIFLNLNEYYTVENDKTNANKSILNAFELGKNDNGYIKYEILIKFLNISENKYSRDLLIYYEELYSLFEKLPEEKSPTKFNYLAFLNDYEIILTKYLKLPESIIIQNLILDILKTKSSDLDYYNMKLLEFGYKISRFDNQLAEIRMNKALEYELNKIDKNHINIVKCYTYLANHFQISRDIALAKKNINLGYIILKKNNINKTGVLVFFYESFGRILCSNGEFSEGLFFYNKALSLYENNLLNKDGKYFDLKVAITTTHYFSNKEINEEELEMLYTESKKYSEESQIEVLFKMIAIYEKLNQKKALLLIYESIRLTKKQYGEDSVPYFLSIENLVTVNFNDSYDTDNIISSEIAINDLKSNFNKYHTTNLFLKKRILELNFLLMLLKLDLTSNDPSIEVFDDFNTEIKNYKKEFISSLGRVSSSQIELELQPFFEKNIKTFAKMADFHKETINLNAFLLDFLIIQKGLFYKIVPNFRKKISTISPEKYKHLQKEISKLSFVYNSEIQDDLMLLERELYNKVDIAFFDNFSEIDSKKISKNLQKNEIAIEFFLEEKDKVDYFSAIILKQNSNPIKLELCPKNAIESLLNNNFNNGNFKIIESIFNNSKLFELLIKPLINEIEPNSKIYFAPSDILNRINLQAIQTPDGKRLSDKFNLTQLSSTAEILNTTNFTIDKTATFSFWGDIDYSADSSALVNHSTSNSLSTSYLSVAFRDSQGKEFLPLEKTKDEVLLASKLFAKENVQLMLGNQATEENLKALSSKEKSPTVLHIATHGFYFAKKEETTDNTFDFVNNKDKFQKADNPLLRSGLIMAGANRVWKGGKAYKGLEDGILTAEEVANMNLFDTKLVVLSACKSGLGDIKSNSEGVYGLQRAFKMAGVEYLLVSLWDIEDDTTQKMMQLFYGKLKDGKTIEEAYNYMVATTRSKYPNEPAKWASFVLMR